MKALKSSLGILVLFLVAVPAEAAGKLIMMRNGKVLKARSVEPDGEWLMATFEGEHVMGIRADLILSVEDDLRDDDDEFGEVLNVVTSGRYVPRSSSGSSRRSINRGDRNSGADPLTEEQQNPTQQQPAGTVVGGARRMPGPGNATQPGAQPGQQPGQQQPGVQNLGTTVPRAAPLGRRRGGIRGRPAGNN